jgi:hypothetical protein
MKNVNDKKQIILVIQQDKRGESKVEGIRKYGQDRFEIKTISIDVPLPPVIDNAFEYLPDKIEADLVLDFTKHPDISHDLALMCRKLNIPVIASGKKIKIEDVITPPT